MNNKFDLHIHSCYSNNLYGTKLLCPPSSSLPEEILDTAIKKRLRAIAITDHDNIVGSLRTLELSLKRCRYRKKIIVIPGVEVSSLDGHILAYNVYNNIPKNLPADQTIKIIKDQGGVAVAAHPFNIKYSLSKKKVKSLQKELFSLEATNSHSLKNKEVQKYTKKNNLAYTAGSDAHSLQEIGLCYGVTKRKIYSIKDMLDIIENKDIEQIVTNDKKFIRRVAYASLKSFAYWKKQQFKHLYNKKVFLPYRDTKLNFNMDR